MNDTSTSFIHCDVMTGYPRTKGLGPWVPSNWQGRRKMFFDGRALAIVNFCTTTAIVTFLRSVSITFWVKGN